MPNLVTQPRYRELDALRGIAAIAVVLFHFTLETPLADYGFRFGVTGVDLFFIISGFVIFMSISKVNSGVQFAINRAARLYPSYWACVTIAFLVVLLNAPSQTNVGQYLANMTMFQHYLFVPNIDEPYWTLIVEMVFYIVVLLLFQLKALQRIVLLFMALSVLAAVLTNYFYGVPVRLILLYVPLLQFAPLFLAGILFYRIYHRTADAYENYILLAACFLCQVMLFRYVGKAASYMQKIEYAAVLAAYFGLFILFVNGKLGFVVSKASLFLGKISYALYLVHAKFGTVFLIPFLVKQLHLSFAVAAFAIALPVVIILAALITYYIEVPLSKLIKQRLYANRLASRKG